MSKSFWVYIYLSASMLLLSCGEPRVPVDTIITANKIYICNEAFDVAEAIAIKDSKIVAFGSQRDINYTYSSENIQDYVGVIYPGFIDAHSHFYGYGNTLNKVDLRETTSLENVTDKTVEFAQNSNEYWITGRGWDQTNWEQKGTISNLRLSVFFPDRPVFIKRIDGHAGLANAKALELAGITPATQIDGGTIAVKNGQLTGLITDNAMALVDNIIPPPSRASEIQALLKAQENCFKAGLTTVTDAGLDLSTILLIDSLQQSGDLTIRIYAMANPNEENFTYFEKNGEISTNRLQVSSIKIYADGALGSRGARLKQPYCDQGNNTGIWVTSPNQIDSLCQRIDALDFQANTHCIGDSANRLVLGIYGNYLKDKNDKRWRIEHAQVVTPVDRELFTRYSILPSVQPTHATSDMNWANNRLCMDRMQGAYAYKSLLALNGYLPLGTDFPVEEIYPLHTFHAAVYRQDKHMKPLGGFLPEESLSTKQALLGMTRWAAKANRMEDRIGSLAIGKLADYVVLDRDIVYEKYMLKTSILKTVIANQ
jgi:predicted amidohydrolase YtcJ